MSQPSDGTEHNASDSLRSFASAVPERVHIDTSGDDRGFASHLMHVIDTLVPPASFAREQAPDGAQHDASVSTSSLVASHPNPHHHPLVVVEPTPSLPPAVATPLYAPRSAAGMPGSGMVYPHYAPPMVHSAHVQQGASQSMRYGGAGAGRYAPLYAVAQQAGYPQSMYGDSHVAKRQCVEEPSGATRGASLKPPKSSSGKAGNKAPPRPMNSLLELVGKNAVGLLGSLPPNSPVRRELLHFLVKNLATSEAVAVFEVNPRTVHRARAVSELPILHIRYRPNVVRRRKRHIQEGPAGDHTEIVFANDEDRGQEAHTPVEEPVTPEAEREEQITSPGAAPEASGGSDCASASFDT